MTDKKYAAYVQKYGFFLLCAFLTIICAYVCFARLDYARIQNWDEARHGVNAYEMMRNHNYIVNTYNYENDYFNLKPPLSYWGIILGFRIFGTNVFGMRFYAALSMLLTFLMIAFWLYRRAGKTACLTSMFLMLTFHDIFYWHAARNADADALYLLLFTFGCLNLIESIKKPSRLYVCGLMFSLCFLAKSWHACVLLPIGALFVLLSGLIKELKLRNYIFFIISAFAPILLWGVVRYQYDGMDFLGQMFGVDVTQRIAWSASSNADYSFFMKYLIHNRAFWVMTAVICFSALFLVLWRNKLRRQEGENVNPLVLALFLWIAVPFLVFSLSHTYYYWYIYPIYPALCIAASLLTERCMKCCQSRRHKMIFLLIMALPFLAVLHYDRVTVSQIDELERSGFQQDIKAAMEQYPQMHGMTIYVEKNDNEYKDSYCWEQAELLMAELSGDLKCQDGGIKAFLQEKGEVLLAVDPYFYEMYKEQLADYPIFYENEYMLLGNMEMQE